MTSIEEILSSHDICATEDNVKVLETILNNWQTLLSLKEEADFWVHSVAIWGIPEEKRDHETETLQNTNEDLDGCSLYSGDTNADHDNVKDIICQLFYNKDSADTRYTAQHDL